MIWMFKCRDNINNHDRNHWEDLCSTGGYLVPHVVIAGEYSYLGDFALKVSWSTFR